MNCRIILFIALALSVGVATGFSQGAPKEIHSVLTNQVEAWNSGDIDGYMKGYWNSDSTVFVSGGTITRGYAEVLTRYKKSYNTREKMGRLESSDLVIRMMRPDLAVATGIWRLKRSTDEPWGRFTLLFEKKPEGWRIIHDHTSSGN